MYSWLVCCVHGLQNLQILSAMICMAVDKDISIIESRGRGMDGYNNY